MQGHAGGHCTRRVSLCPSSRSLSLSLSLSPFLSLRGIAPPGSAAFLFPFPARRKHSPLLGIREFPRDIRGDSDKHPKGLCCSNCRRGLFATFSSPSVWGSLSSTSSSSTSSSSSGGGRPRRGVLLLLPPSPLSPLPSPSPPPFISRPAPLGCPTPQGGLLNPPPPVAEGSRVPGHRRPWWAPAAVVPDLPPYWFVPQRGLKGACNSAVLLCT